jgi:hypothetical protein
MQVKVNQKNDKKKISYKCILVILKHLLQCDTMQEITKIIGIPLEYKHI